MCIGTGTAVALAVTAATTATGAIVAARAGSHAADVQAHSTDVAADAQAKAEADKLAFEQHQAALDQQNFEATQRANYDQARAAAHSGYADQAARQRRIGNLGGLIGEGPREIPAFEYPDYAGPSPSGAPPGSLGGLAAPGSTTPIPNNDTQALLATLLGDKRNDMNALYAAAPQLAQYGIQVTPPNAAGERTKIFDPVSGQWTRVIGNGEGRPVWLPQGAAGGAPMSKSAVLPQRGTLGMLAVPGPQVLTPRLREGSF